MKTVELLYKEECFEIQGAIFDVYSEVGCGFLEAVYQECLEREFSMRGIPFSPQQELKIVYKGQLLEQTYKPDFVLYDKIIVEIKSVDQISDIHKAQVMNYLKLTGFKLGLLVNFGSFPKVDIVRMAN